MAVEPEDSDKSSVTNRPVSQRDLHGVREDFILIFGLFASVLIFLSIEVQVFQKAPRFSYVVGLSLFLLGAMQMFVLSLRNIVKDKNNLKDDYLKKPCCVVCRSVFSGSCNKLYNW